jgi:hypothetical protein
VPTVYAWLLKLSTNKNFRRWLVTVGPVATKAFANFLGHMRNRESGIRQAHEIDGQFSVATIDGKRHVVVWKDGRPFSAFPEVEGDLEEKLEHYNRTLLKRPDDLARRRAQRWVSSKTGSRSAGRAAEPSHPPLPKELPVSPDRE